MSRYLALLGSSMLVCGAAARQDHPEREFFFPGGSAWRSPTGIEPARDRVRGPANGFEDRAGHQLRTGLRADRVTQFRVDRDQCRPPVYARARWAVSWARFAWALRPEVEGIR